MDSLKIAHEHEPEPIAAVAARLGLRPEEIEPYGRHVAKIPLSALDRRGPVDSAKLVAVTSMTPTRAGEGCTTTLIGLVDALGRIGRNPVGALREGSVGAMLGATGRATGGGRAQVVPVEKLNLHFTGDVHAIAAANNLLAAMIDVSILHGNPHAIDAIRVPWRRAVDMSDRTLRKVVIGLEGRSNGYPRETGFDIAAASEVMAITAVARDLHDLRRRIGRITAAYSYDGRPVTAEDVGAAGAMTVLLKDAIKPNLVQTLEGRPVLVHCGPFANIDHGNNSLIADVLGLRLGEYVLTEAGFGSDMGLEKFVNIVSRLGRLTPSAAVLVTTVRAIKHHGGLVGDDDGSRRRAEQAALTRGMANVRRHLEIIATFGLPAVVAINRRAEDTPGEIECVRRAAVGGGAFAAEVSEAFGRGGRGAVALAEAVVAACDQPSRFRHLYADEQPIQDKIEAVATHVYGARDVYFYPEAEHALGQFTREGLGHLPVCIAKTHLSLSADASIRNAPTGFTLAVRDVRAYTGAGWLVPLCGDITQMPGLGRCPAALDLDIDADGRIVGLA